MSKRPLRHKDDSSRDEHEKTSRRRTPGIEVNSRERILKAAREVFSRHSYNEASTRMVAKQAGVEHPLIHYYFGSKEKLFQAMAEAMFEDVSRVQDSWFEGLSGISPAKGLASFLDRLLDYTFANPEMLQIAALNMMHIGRIEEIPGYRFITLHMARMKRILEEKLPLRVSSREIEMYIYSFYSLLVSLIGAKSCHAHLLNMDPSGTEYRAWIKDTCMTIFLPWLERLLPPRRSAPE
jgi:TetR/AcrR family transcriptional regulator